VRGDIFRTRLLLPSALEDLGGQRHAVAALPSGKRLGTHCTAGWLGPHSRSGRVRKISPPTGIRSLGRAAVARRFTDHFRQVRTRQGIYV
jgi:hypothetical protein